MPSSRTLSQHIIYFSQTPILMKFISIKLIPQSFSHKQRYRNIKKFHTRFIHPKFRSQMHDYYLYFIQIRLNYNEQVIMQNQEETVYRTQNDELLNWIQSINHSTKQKRAPLQQQLQAITESYKNAQQKLLSLQKQLYYQSLYNQKQRSIIQILKHLLQQNLDDQTILTYIMNLQQQNSSTSLEKQLEKKYQIRNQLEEIKEIIYQRKNRAIKSENSKDIVITDLKKEIKKTNLIKRELMQDIDRLINEKEDVQNKLLHVQSTVQEMSQQNRKLVGQIQEINSQLEQSKQNTEQVSQRFEQVTKKIISEEEKRQKLKEKITKFIKKNQESLNETPSETSLTLDQIAENLCRKLKKYRNLSIQLNQKVLNNTRNTQLISIAKLFMPTDAQEIIDQYTKEPTSKQYLLKELQNMANLFNKKLSQMEICQQEMWNMKIRYLREKEGQFYPRSTSPLSKENLDPNSNQTHKNTAFYFEKTTQFEP